jgi:hypothetical protein
MWGRAEIMDITNKILPKPHWESLWDVAVSGYFNSSNLAGSTVKQRVLDLQVLGLLAVTSTYPSATFELQPRHRLVKCSALSPEDNL